MFESNPFFEFKHLKKNKNPNWKTLSRSDHNKFTCFDYKFIRDKLESLTELEKKIVNFKYWLAYPDSKICKLLGIKKPELDQILSKVEHTLKHTYLRDDHDSSKILH